MNNEITSKNVKTQEDRRTIAPKLVISNNEVPPQQKACTKESLKAGGLGGGSPPSAFPNSCTY